MKTKTLLLLLILFSAKSFSQNVIAVQNGNNATFYSNIDSAINHAANGDTIYLPGGWFTLNAIINRSIHLVGTGAVIDSTIATGLTLLNSPIIITSGASGGSIEGVCFANSNSYAPSIYFGYGGDTIPISDFSIFRCKITNGILFILPCNLFSIRQNVIGTFYFTHQFGNGQYTNNISLKGQISNSSIVNNKIYGLVSEPTNDYFSNNIFLGSPTARQYFELTYCTFENNMFNNGNDPGYCTFNNNLNTSAIQYNLGINNLIGNLDNEFVNLSTGDFHLRINAQGRNAGTDGTDIGIYGGSFPWKEGMIPSNPHIQAKNISGVTDTNGNLHINIKVAAQEH